MTTPTPRNCEVIRTGIFFDGQKGVPFGTPNAAIDYAELAAALRKIAAMVMKVEAERGVIIRMAADEVDLFTKTIGWDVDDSSEKRASK